MRNMARNQIEHKLKALTHNHTGFRQIETSTQSKTSVLCVSIDLTTVPQRITLNLQLYERAETENCSLNFVFIGCAFPHTNFISEFNKFSFAHTDTYSHMLSCELLFRHQCQRVFPFSVFHVS